MKRKLFILILIVILIVLAAVGYNTYRRKNERDCILTLYGNVDVRQVDIGFRVSGIVETLCFEEGDCVPKGALMAKLDTTPYTSQVAQSEANIAQVKANLENAEALLKRRQELIGIGGVSQETLDDALANRNSLRANLAANEAALKVAQDNLSYTQAFAPTEGVILTRIREPGTVVNPSDPVYTLSITSPVWIRAYVSETNLGRIAFGMDADVYIDAPHSKVYTGKIGFISPVSEFTPKTVETTRLRTDLVYRLRIYVDNPDQLLKQGMPVTVKLKLNKKECPLPKEA